MKPDFEGFLSFKIFLSVFFKQNIYFIEPITSNINFITFVESFKLWEEMGKELTGPWWPISKILWLDSCGYWWKNGQRNKKHNHYWQTNSWNLREKHTRQVNIGLIRIFSSKNQNKKYNILPFFMFPTSCLLLWVPEGHSMTDNVNVVLTNEKY